MSEAVHEGPYRPPAQEPEAVVIQYLMSYGGEWTAVEQRDSQPSCRVFYDKRHKRSIPFNLDWLEVSEGTFDWRKMIDDRMKRWY